MTVNFTAKFLTDTYIPTRLPNGDYVPNCVSIVELDKNNTNDMRAVLETTTNCDKNGGKFGRNIYSQMKNPDYDAGIKTERYIALTTQTADFDKLKPQYIQGLMILSKNYYEQNELSWLETNPQIVNAEKGKKPYKCVGTSLVNFAKQECKQGGIYVIPAINAVEFYKKLGFKVKKDEFIDEIKWEA